MRLPCWIKHDWSPWGMPFAFSYRSFQNRHCIRCSKTQQRETGWATESEMAQQCSGMKVRLK